jgi:hypothetical protein
VLWLVVPGVVIAGALAALAAIRSLESARRDLQRQVASLADVRAGLVPVQRQIDAARATAVARDRR